ncbi:hypothetical protein EVAR_39044_1 [Eumeta japonica]|uniref:Uncharacterized protein n=1 Tax=Eumeta variegata TaxID=151549 RepID=A0A4C1WPU8_EUMVA|nr:hypothetical protein EVAR_39044_1 [Eumeta japonica]
MPDKQLQDHCLAGRNKSSALQALQPQRRATEHGTTDSRLVQMRPKEHSATSDESSGKCEEAAVVRQLQSVEPLFEEPTR